MSRKVSHASPVIIDGISYVPARKVKPSPEIAAEVRAVRKRLASTDALLKRATHEQRLKYDAGAADTDEERASAAFGQLRGAVHIDAIARGAPARRAGMAETRKKHSAHKHVGSDADEENRATAVHLKDRHGWGKQRIAKHLGFPENTGKKVVTRWLTMPGPVRSRGEPCPMCKNSAPIRPDLNRPV